MSFLLLLPCSFEAPKLKEITCEYSDLSYNYFVVSSLPSLVNQPNLQLNLVANNFTLENSRKIYLCYVNG
uniref:Uncharacterized protein n=1 Tax=Quercus lobata TaxID=97700 RepID=A0A7N2LHK9_QUELO